MKTQDFVKVNLKVDDVYLPIVFADFFINELDGINCLSRLLGYDVDFNKATKNGESSIRIGFYKNQTFYFEFMLFYKEKDKIVLIPNIRFLFNDGEISKTKIMEKCNNLGLDWDGFYDIGINNDKDLNSVFSIIKCIV